MPLDRRITGGLAWAGLLLVVAVPSIDALTSLLSPDEDANVLPAVVEPAVAAAAPPVEASVPVAEAQPVTETVAETAPAEPASGGGAVDRYLASGRELPSYISDGGSSVAAAAPAVQPMPEPAPQADDVSVASISPQQANPAPAAQPELIAPIPMPASMRPHPQAASRPVPPAAIGQEASDDTYVGPDELQDWESGPLSEFLAKRQELQDAGGGTYTEYSSDGPAFSRY